ncbi:hypothetical protein FGG08_001785 [Glutinoglossum americanum]|uniref:Cytochrome P450 monooxygenase ABA1 n=1 Tax=Glutinoglossum americanum TaxID=1670608 RepID=A0A9P8I1B4_9PEZI|nr:hypothetical protein FGG08_001785 [Glutinoglossum americanum]
MAGEYALFLGTVVVGAVAWLAVQRFAVYWRLRAFPGPFLGKFSKLWVAWGAATRRLNVEYQTLCEKYGPVVRIAQNDLITDDPEIIVRINAVRSPYTRSEFYASAKLDPSRDNILSTRDEVKHQALRQKMASGYSGKDNPALEPGIDKHILNLINLINAKYLSTSSSFRPLDFGRKAHYLTLDLISEIAFGEAFGDITEDRDVHEYIQMIEEKVGAMVWVTVFPGLNKILQIPWIARAVMPSDKDEIGMGKVMGVAKRVVAERFGPDKKVREDMLGSFIRRGLTQEEVYSESLLQIIAGSDTTATALRATILYVITNPRVHAALRREIDAFLSQNPPADPASVIPDAAARTLPYLHACIREGLRMNPPIPALLSKKVPPEGDTINGVFVPGGTGIGCCSFGIQRNKAAFGEDSNIFRPERWLEARGADAQRMERTADLVFGSGKFQCLGKSVAMIELRKILFELVARFDLAIVDPTKPWKSENMGFFLQSEMFIRASTR